MISVSSFPGQTFYSFLLSAAVIAGCPFTSNVATAQKLAQAEKNADRIKPYAANPRYWQYHGKPVLLLGGSKDDSLFQIPGLKNHLDEIQAAGGNYIRNTMSDRRSKKTSQGSGGTEVFGYEVYPFKQLPSGKYDLNQWNNEYWKRFANMLKWTHERDIIVQIEVWDRFDFTDFRGANHWRQHPYNPTNNINYTSENSGLATEYSKNHPGRDVQPFFHTIPGMDKYQPKYDTIRRYQERFVDKLLSYSLPYGNVLYCMNNETSSSPKWGRYWIKFIRHRAQELGVDAYTTDMFDNGFTPEESQEIRLSFDQPDIYNFIDISQVNSRSYNEDHWDKLMWYSREIKKYPRPLNNTKIYGSGYKTFGTGAPEDGVERFWRDLFSGCASVRFHRPDSGNGLNDFAKGSIKAARTLEGLVKFWELTPRMDLLSHRQSNEAYLVAKPGEAYALYFTNGGSVDVDLSGATKSFDVTWLSISMGIPVQTSATGRYRLMDKTVDRGSAVTFSAPYKGPWVVAIVPAK